MTLSTLVAQGSAETATASATPKTKVTVWCDGRHDYEYMLKKFEEYNATNKDNIEASIEVYTDNYTQTLKLAFETGNGPDIFGTGQQAWDLAKAGKALPLNNYLDADFKTYLGGDSAIIEGVNMFNGKILSLPFNGGTVRLMYNQDIFDKAGITKVPTTFDEVITAARQITKKLSGEGIYGFAINMKSPSSALGRTLNYMMTNNCGVGNGYDFKTGEYHFEKAKPVIEFLKTLMADDIAFPGCDQLDIDPLRTQFAAGHIGMYYSYSSAEPGVYANQFPTKANWNMAPLTTINGTPTGKQNMDAGKKFCISSASKNPDAAWKVMKYIYSADVLGGYYSEGLGAAVVQYVIDNYPAPENIKKMPLAGINNETDAIWPSAPNGIVLEGQDYYTVIGSYLLGINGYGDLDAVLADLNKRYNAGLKKGIDQKTATYYVFPHFDPKNPGGTMN